MLAVAVLVMDGDIPITAIPHPIDQAIGLIDTQPHITVRITVTAETLGITATTIAMAIVDRVCTSKDETSVSDFDIESRMLI
jgi:hypothetical protein